MPEYLTLELERIADRFAADNPYINLADAQLCNEDGDTESEDADPKDGAPDGQVWIKKRGSGMPIPAWNSVAFEGMVGHWVKVGEERKSGDLHVLYLLTRENTQQGGDGYRAGVAQGPTPPPEMMRPQHKFDATVPPTVTDDSDAGFVPAALWGGNELGKLYGLRDNTAGAADWFQIAEANTLPVIPHAIPDGVDVVIPDGYSTLAIDSLTLEGSATLTLEGDATLLILDTHIEETIQDVIGASLVAGPNISVSYSDVTGLTTAGFSGLLPHENGGLERDVSAASGLLSIIGGTTYDTLAVPIKVKNTSGGTAAAQDIGYLTPAGEYKTTSAANDANVGKTGCVVLVGGANNADIYVLRGTGRVPLKLNNNCSIGDLLTSSTTAGQAAPTSIMRPEVFALAMTANAGGAGGTCEALLLHDEPMVLESATDLYAFVSASTSDFVATINGAPSGSTLTYNTPSSGNENVPVPSGTLLGKMVLYNTTRGDSAQISSVNTGTNVITLTASAPGAWANGDTITIRSQTNTDSPAGYFADIAIDDTSVIPANGCMIDFVFHTLTDTGGVATILAHPFKAGVASARRRFGTNVASVSNSSGMYRVAFIQRRFELEWQATGAGTLSAQLRIMGCVVKVP